MNGNEFEKCAIPVPLVFLCSPRDVDNNFGNFINIRTRVIGLHYRAFEV